MFDDTTFVSTDVESDDNEGEIEKSTLLESLAQMHHNFALLQAQKKDTERYYDEMQETMDQKEEMIRGLHSRLHEIRLKTSTEAHHVGPLDGGTAEEENVRRRNLPARPKTIHEHDEAINITESKEVVALRSKIERLEDTVQFMESKLKESDIIKDELHEEIQETKRAVFGDDSRAYQDVTENNLELEIEQQQLKRAQEDQEKMLSERDEELQLCYVQITALEDIVDEQDATIERLANDIKCLERDAQDLSEAPPIEAESSVVDVSLHQTELEDARAQIDGLQSQLDAATSRRTKTTHELEGLRVQLTEAAVVHEGDVDELERLRLKLESASDERGRDQLELRQLRTRLDTASLQYANDLREQLQQQRVAHHRDLLEHQETQSRHANELRAQLQDQQTQLAKAAARHATDLREQQQLQAQHVRDLHEQQQLQAKLKEAAQAHTSHLREQLETAHAELSSMGDAKDETLSSLQRVQLDLKDEIRQLQALLVVTETKQANAQQDLTQTRTELNELEMVHETTVQHESTLEVLLAEAKLDHEQSARDVQRMQSQLQTVQEQRDESISQLHQLADALKAVAEAEAIETPVPTKHILVTNTEFSAHSDDGDGEGFANESWAQATMVTSTPQRVATTHQFASVDSSSIPTTMTTTLEATRVLVPPPLGPPPLGPPPQLPVVALIKGKLAMERKRAQKAEKQILTIKESEVELRAQLLAVHTTLKHKNDTDVDLEASVAQATDKIRHLETENKVLHEKIVMLATQPKTMTIPLPDKSATKKFKGMTLVEQKKIFNEILEYKMAIDELKSELTDAKASSAKKRYDAELQDIFNRKRNRLILQILQKPLSSADRRLVTNMLKNTDTAPDAKPFTPPPSSIKNINNNNTATTKHAIGRPVSGSFRRVPLEETMAKLTAAKLRNSTATATTKANVNTTTSTPFTSTNTNTNTSASTSRISIGSPVIGSFRKLTYEDGLALKPT
eukprot:m.192813 g.192813  ORF g.192813 m.192813 type:complete len:972 (-) comp32485_c0_seq1:24-2939(-)